MILTLNVPHNDLASLITILQALEVETLKKLDNKPEEGQYLIWRARSEFEPEQYTEEGLERMLLVIDVTLCCTSWALNMGPVMSGAAIAYSPIAGPAHTHLRQFDGKWEFAGIGGRYDLANTSAHIALILNSALAVRKEQSQKKEAT